MKMTAGRTFLLWLLAMLAGAAIVWNTRFTADMSFFLPSHPSAEQQVLVDQLKEGVVSRLLMLAIEGGEAEQRAAISRDLRGRLAKMPEFVSVQNGEAGSQDADRAFLFKHRYLLSPAITPERFTVAGLQAAIANSIDLLASPAGMMLKPMLARDPTGELIEMLSGLNAGAQPNSRNGVWASRDGERAMLLVQTQALGSDTDGQEAAINRLHSEFAASAEAAGITNAKLQLSGPGLFAVNSRATIKDEVSRLKSGEGQQEFTRMVEIYKRQAVDELYSSSMSKDSFKSQEEILLTRRNKDWIPKITKIVHEQPTFFAVGAAHLGGPNGVVRLLREAGYTVTAVMK